MGSKIFTMNKPLTLKHILYILLVSALLVTGFIFCKNKYYQYKYSQIIDKAQKIEPNFWLKKYQDIEIKNKYKIVMIVSNGGELTYSEYFKYAAQKKNWDIRTYKETITGKEDEILEFNPDMILFLSYSETEMNKDLDSRINAHRSKKYGINLSFRFQPLTKEHFFKKGNPYIRQKKLETFYKQMHGILSNIYEIDIYRGIFENINKPFNGFRLFPTIPEFINKPAEPKKLMWISGGWDKYRSSSRYKNFINKLAENIPMKVYGHYLASSFLKKPIYDGYIYPGIENIEAIRKNGIYLLTHSEEHFYGKGTPTIRLFEAVAANVIVISDKHPFAIENFGDNFLYFDQNSDSDTMYNQVKAHMDWIKENPEKAKEMAARAHAIFLEKFTLEADLVQIAKMHEYVLKQEKEMNLSYPIGY